MHSESASAGSTATGICGKNAASARALQRLFSPGVWLFSSHPAAGHSSWTQHFVCISVSSERVRPAAECCLYAHIRRRTTAPTTNCALGPAPLPASSLRPMATSSLTKIKHEEYGGSHFIYSWINKMTRIRNNQSYKSEIMKGISKRQIQKSFCRIIATNERNYGI